MWSNQEIVFAQKATAIVKAAGMDPRLLDLEQFRLLAPVIFTRSYCAIYKENQFSLDTESSKEEVILISQLVIDGLVAKTRNPALSMITGFDVFQRNHRAIGILVGILFDEGQRLWLEKRGSFNTNSLNSKKLKITRNSSRDEAEQENDSPREIRKLLNKIDSLEGQIKRTKPAEDDKLIKAQSFRSEISDVQNSEKDGGISNQSSPKPRKRPTSASGLSSSAYSGGTTRLRPSSAGTARVVQQLRLQEPTDQLNLPAPPNQPPRSPDSSNHSNSKRQVPSNFTYDMKSGRKIPLKQTNDVYNQQQIITDLDQLNQNKQAIHNSLYPNEKKKSYQQHIPARPEYPGKRIEKSVEEWLKKMQEIDKCVADPHYQSPMFDGMAAPVPNSALSNVGVVVYHPVYALMEDYDLVLSIEHCHNCSHHNVSLRHDPKEYLQKAQKMIKQFASSLFHGQYCVRVGIGVIPADLSTKNENSSRIGAFEVQVAYKSPQTGSTEIEIVYSKLQTRRWPSKSVVDKRLETFLSKHKIPRIKSSSLPDDYEMVIASSGRESYSYPRGKCDFDIISIAHQGWDYNFHVSNHFNEYLYDFRSLIPKEYNRPRSLNTSLPSPRNERTAVHHAGSIDVASKENPLPFAVGQKVLVANVQYTTDCIEPHPLPGVIKKLPSFQNSSADSALIITPRELANRKYKVQLSYSSNEIEIAEHDISLEDPECLASDRSAIPLNHELPMPVELKGFFALLQKESLLHLWKFPESGDQINILTGEPEYSFKTVFQSLRAMVWEYKSILFKRNELVSNSIAAISVQHPKTGEIIDIHHLYSDDILRWIFYSSHNGSINRKEYVSQLYMLNLFPKEEETVIAIAVEQNAVAKESEMRHQDSGELLLLEAFQQIAPVNDVNADSSETYVSLSSRNRQMEQVNKEDVSSLPIQSNPFADVGTNLIPPQEVSLSRDPPPSDIAESNLEVVDPADLNKELALISAVDAPFSAVTQSLPTPAITAPASNSPRKASEQIPLIFENKDIVISSIILEGTVLSHEYYDSLFVTFIFETYQKEAKVCLAREKGSKRRSFNVSWDEIPITSFAFQENAKNINKSCVYVVLSICDQALLTSQPNLPYLQTSELGKSQNTCQLSLSEFYKDSFEIKCEATLPNFHPINVTTSHTPATSNSPTPVSTDLSSSAAGKVLITINGHAHEAMENRRSRILSMKPVELLKLKFEPLPVDDEYSDDENDEPRENDQQSATNHVVLSDQSPHFRKTVHQPNPQDTIVEGDDENGGEREDEVLRRNESNILATNQEEHNYESSFEQAEPESEHIVQENLQKSLFPKASFFNLLAK